MRQVGAWLAMGMLLFAAASAHAAAMETLDQAVCRMIETSAHANHLPSQFLTRIIWRESNFQPHAVSPKGAQGIAQFMPETAAARGLADPFDPEQAIAKAGRLLSDLKQQFGNLGLAAAAYNSGSDRVRKYLAHEGGLPAETRAYVIAVTQSSVEDWTGPAARSVAGGATVRSCLAEAAELRREGFGDSVSGIWAPWGVQLAGNFSKPLALATFERARARYARVIGAVRPMIIGRLLRSRGTRTFYQVRVPAATRGEASALCSRIQAVGGSCVPLRS